MVLRIAGDLIVLKLFLFSCDKYYSCENGTATLKICGNGLVFDDAGMEAV